MKKLYFFILITLGMIFYETAHAQLNHLTYPIKRFDNTKLRDHFELNALGKIVGFTGYEPTVHPATVPVHKKTEAAAISITPGTLSTTLTPIQKDTITSLKITGQIDARDFKTMRDNMPALSVIDISNISIASYTGTQGTAGSTVFTYPQNTIPQKAFASDNQLTTIFFPTSIVSIADSAFYNCGLTGNLTIPNGVVSIGNSAFESCWNLTGTITLPNSVTNLGKYVFSNCQNFTTLLLSNSLTSISDHAFDGDWSMTGNLTIPHSVTSIGDYAFYYSYLTGVTIPNSVTSIGIGAFSKSKFLTGNLILPNSMTSISDYAFSLCARLTSITIPNSVTLIGNYAFTMSGVTSITIPDSVVSIGDGAFALTPLNSITIPPSVTSLGNGSFDCPGLSSVYVNSIVPIVINDSVGVFYNKTTCTLYVPAGSGTLYQKAHEWKDFGSIIEMAPDGLNELTGKQNILLYPNPVRDGCTINTGENPAMVSLYSLAGVLLMSRQVTDKSYLDMSGLPAGQYIVKINTSNGIVEKKLIKK